MSDDIQRVFVKPPDFASVYADGVMLQIGEELSRLVFYQRGIEPSEDGSQMDKEREYVSLRFEVRLPRTALSDLADNIVELLKLKEKAWKMTKGRNKDDKVVESWWLLDGKIGRFLYNTDEDEIDGKAVEDLNAQYDDLIGRAKGRPQVEHDESDKLS